MATMRTYESPHASDLIVGELAAHLVLPICSRDEIDPCQPLGFQHDKLTHNLAALIGKAEWFWDTH